jgi:predicted nucleic acid-binding protein
MRLFAPTSPDPKAARVAAVSATSSPRRIHRVFLEVVTVLRARRGAAAATEVAEQLLNAHEVDFVPCSDFFVDTLQTFRQEPAELSFTDAAIVTVARRERKGYVATFDSDFRNLAGITVIPGADAR